MPIKQPVQIDAVSMVEMLFQVGPKKAAAKIKKEFVMFAARDFERRVNKLLAGPQKHDPKPQPKPAARINPDVVIDAEIVNPNAALGAIPL